MLMTVFRVLGKQGVTEVCSLQQEVMWERGGAIVGLQKSSYPNPNEFTDLQVRVK